MLFRKYKWGVCGLIEEDFNVVKWINMVFKEEEVVLVESEIVYEVEG